MQLRIGQQKIYQLFQYALAIERRPVQRHRKVEGLYQELIHWFIAINSMMNELSPNDEIKRTAEVWVPKKRNANEVLRIRRFVANLLSSKCAVIDRFALLQ